MPINIQNRSLRARSVKRNRHQEIYVLRKWQNEDSIIETMFKKPDYEKGKPFSQDVKYKGSRNITGDKKENGKLNELGGAIV